MAYLERLIKYILAFRCMQAFATLSIGLWIGPASSAAEDIIIYGMNGYDNYDFVEVSEINLTANSSQPVGIELFDTEAIDQHPMNGKVYYVEWADAGNRLAYWNPVDGSELVVRTYDPIPWVRAKRAAFGPDGFLYVMDTEETLFRIDAASGDWEDMGEVQGIQSGTFFQASGDIAFTPDGRLYLVTQDSLYEVDMQTLQATLLFSDMLPGSSMFTNVWTGLAYCEGSLYASHVEGSLFFGTINSSIFSIDIVTGEVNELIDTGTLINDLTSCPAIEGEEPCVGDYEPDGDVDGIDLLHQIAGELNVTLEDFALFFGRSDCPTTVP